MEVEATSAIDIFDAAREIEMVAGQYFIPYERGLYTPLRGFPVIRAENNIDYQVHTHRKDIAIYTGAELYANPELITGDVYDMEGHCVLAGKSKNLVAKSPYQPHRTLLFLNLLVDGLLIDHFAFRRKHQTPTMREQLLTLLDGRQGFGDKMDEETLGTFNDIYDAVDIIVSNIREQVYTILDNYRFHIHTCKLRDNLIVIERHIDYRIFYFNMKTENGKKIDL